MGHLEVGQQLFWRLHGTVRVGVIMRDGGIWFSGGRYESPSGAAMAAAGRSEDGWKVWHVGSLDGPTLSDLRSAVRARMEQQHELAE